jgi:hypothetical protein
MGRRSHTKSLTLWMNGLPVGTWETTRDGEKLSYFEDWIADEQVRPLSLSLPFTAGHQDLHWLAATERPARRPVIARPDWKLIA